VRDKRIAIAQVPPGKPQQNAVPMTGLGHDRGPRQRPTNGRSGSGYCSLMGQGVTAR
jgi:hypothetical protein